MADITVTISAVDKTSPVLIKISGAAKKAGSDLESAGAKGRKGLEDIEKGGKKADTALRTFERTSLAVGATVGALALGLVRVSAAYTQQERQLAAVSRLYGEAGDEIVHFAEAIQNTTRFSNDAARQSAIVLNTLVANYGLAQDQIETLISRSADLAALHGKSLEEISQMVSNALRGEGEYIEQIGVTMNQTFIAAEAAARGMKNFITEMSAAEQAAFRYTIFLEQTATAQGYAMETATGARGAFGLLANEVQDAAQSFGSFLGPVADVAAQFNSYALWLPLIASQTARVSAIMINSARSGALLANTMGVLRFGISPLGILLGVLATGATMVGLKFLEQKQAMAQAAAGAEEAAASYRTLQDVINQLYATGNKDAGQWAQEQLDVSRTFIDDWQKLVADAMKAEKDNDGGWFDNFAEGFTDNFGRFLQGVSFNESMADNLGEFLEGAGEEFDAAALEAFQISDETEAAVNQSLNKVFSLLGNPNLDTAQFQADFESFFQELMKGVINRDIPTDQMDEKIEEFYRHAVEKIEQTQQLFEDMEFDFRLDDLIADDQGELASQLVELESFFDGVINARQRYIDTTLAQAQATGDYSILPDPKRYEEFNEIQLRQLEDIQERFDKILSSGDYDNPAILQAIGDINRAFISGKIDAETYLASLYNLSTGTNKFVLDMEEATYAAKELSGAMKILSADAREGGEAFREAYQENIADFIDSYMSAFQMDDPLSLINMSSLRTEFSALAGDIAQASGRLENVFRVIVENTNAFKDQAQGVHDWIDGLYEAEEGIRRIDTLLQGGYIDESTYDGVIQAHEDIAAAQIEIANNVDAIQAMQAPFIAQFVENQATYLDNLRQMPVEQQRIALAWGDAATSAKAYTVIQAAAAAANGEFGAQGEEIIHSMVEGALLLDPMLFDVWESIGLINGTPLDFEVDLTGMDGAMTEIEMLTLRIEDLIRALGGNLTPIDLQVDGIGDVERANDAVNSLFEQKVRDIAINIKANFDEGSGPISDILAGRVRDIAPLLIPVEYDYDSLPDPSMDSKRLLQPVEIPITYGDLPDIPEITAEDVKIPASIEFDRSALDQAVADVQNQIISGPTFEFVADQSEIISVAHSLWSQVYQGPTFEFLQDTAVISSIISSTAAGKHDGPTFNFQPSVSAVVGAANRLAGTTHNGPTFNFQANTSALQSVINQYAGRTLATSYIDVQVRQTGSISVPGQKRLAHGGIVFRGAEPGPETLHFPNGGTVPIMHDGLYMAPSNTYVSPPNVDRNVGGMTIAPVLQVNAPIYGVDDLDEKLVDFAEIIVDEVVRHQEATGVRR